SFTRSHDAPADFPTLQYAFDCGDGSGYGPFGLTTTSTCPTSSSEQGVRAVKGKIVDKDGGVREYTTNVRVDPPPARVLVGHVTWQSHPAQPSPSQALPITITLKSGTFERNFTGITTDQSGYFTVSVTTLPAGTYSWRARGPSASPSNVLGDPSGYLANCGTITIPSQPQTALEIGLMRAGDGDNNNLVDIADYNILRKSFGKTQGQVNYDTRADFTGDAIVDINDFMTFKLNFGTGGCPPN
ncbi:MAG: hypothetical protein ACJ78Q_14100, partial [Chloroflexia bacterium]